MDIVKITCYGKTDTMERKKAIEFYLNAMMCSEGSEQERYSKILCDLMTGLNECSDE